MKNLFILVLLVAVFYLGFIQKDKIKGENAKWWYDRYDNSLYLYQACLDKEEKNRNLVKNTLEECMVKDNPYTCAWELDQNYEK